MSSRKSSESVALLQKINHGNEETKGRWWRRIRILEVEEAKYQVLLSLPMIISNVSYYTITLVSVMFAGHLGELELAGATLANSWATVTGFAFMIGLSGALETLCGQGYGAKLYRILGLHLQASCIISCFFSIILSILWIYTEPIFIFLHQDPQISKTAAIYLKHLIPGLFAYGFLQNISRFLQAQSIVMPLVWFSVLPLGAHFGIVHVLVNWTSFGLKGASMAASISLWILLVSLAMYVVCTRRLKQTWQGLSSESFRYILPCLKLALPSAAMYCLEDWAFELLVLLAGLMPNSNISTSLIAMCVNTETIVFMFTCGLSGAASTRVANELGAGNPEKAKSAVVVTLKLSIILNLAIAIALAFGHNVWAAFFTDSSVIVKQFASIMPLLVISITLDSFQGIFSAVARGCGWQLLAVWVNLGTYYFIGIPIACILGFMLKLYDKGLWIGITCGLFCQASAFLSITLFRQWPKIDLSERVNTHTNFVEFSVLGWDNLPRTLLMYYTNFVSSPEGYFQTVVCNVPEFVKTVINHDLHYISWDTPPKQHPHILNINDTDKIIRSNAAFARKFIHDPILDKIDTDLLGRENGSFTPGAWCFGTPTCSEVRESDKIKPGPGAQRLGQLISRLAMKAKNGQDQCE